MHETTEKLKAFFNQNNIPVFGIASVDSLEAGPPGHRPSDLLQSAKSILCIPHSGKKLIKTVERPFLLEFQKMGQKA